uniref:Chromosome 19 open reading frame 44 n=1 Tax=Sciurus vulgaris TaxID=55149 RepID=A0A8D2DSI9_SCIVU
MAFTRKISRPAHSIFSDLSDISLDDSKMEDIRNLKVSRSRTQTAPGQSRFLKRNQTTGETHLDLKESAVLGSGTRLALGRPPATASKIRASAALMKLAQIETKIRSRQRSLSDTESDSKPSEDSLPGRVDRTTPRAASGPSSLPAHRTSQKQARESPIPRSSVQPGQVSRFLKRAPHMENATPEARAGKERDLQTPRPKEPAPKFDSPDSDEEEMKELLGSLMESSREKETSINQRYTKVLEKESVRPFTIPAAPRAPSLSSAEPPSSRPPQTPRPPPVRPAHRALRSTRLRACSPQISVSRDAASRASSISIPDTVSRSESSKMGRSQLASSLGGSEPEPVDAPASEAADDSLNDFRVSISSLGDLTPAASGKSDSEQKEGAAQRARPTGRSCSDEAPAGLEVPTWVPPRSSAFQGKATSVVGDEGLPTESEVSEHLSASWASAAQQDSVSGVQSPSETPLESSVGSAYSEDFESPPSPVASEPAAPSQAALERALATLSEGSSSPRTCLQRAPQASGEWGRGAASVTMKEAAVQTLDPAFAYQWAAVLTAYSPAVLALNDMLRQQLSLTRQFIEASRHLHGSLLQSMEGDAFHYHTLEEAKEYIRSHRPTPLTMEDALQEAKEGLC